MTTTTAGASAPALEALRAGACTPACLLSEDTGHCHCRCQGTHHGALLGSLARLAEDETTPTKPGKERRHTRGHKGRARAQSMANGAAGART